jgi:hypothetical protein
MWLRSLLCEWGFSMLMPTTLWSDNSGAIKLTYNPVHHKRTKHIEIEYHLIRDKVKLNEIDVDKIHTSDMLADILTKTFQQESFPFNSAVDGRG